MTAHFPRPPFPAQRQSMPGSTAKMNPRPDHGESSYKGSGKLLGKRAIITGGDSGIGRAVAIAFAREGADILIAYLEENDHAKEVAGLIEKEGRKAVLVEGDLRSADHCREVVDRAVRELGGVDILVNNAAHQATFKDLGDISAPLVDRKAPGKARPAMTQLETANLGVVRSRGFPFPPASAPDRR